MKIIARVFSNKTSGQKIVTIPAKCNIKAGDYVCIVKTSRKKVGII